ncbi:DUF6892 domain-containing protein [[Mycoplasma] gypis]|uniref:Uncharacterized protein n=1 Tax=[Mycoplasma] gypis TaxID=92404 RepID=A0ABZ2RPJ7_9BACT|nr:hypothetical protein [[Mycoplasma] gypis]MBN0919146.1 hypothetical protein [[Mycoplasma] gypis]
MSILKNKESNYKFEIFEDKLIINQNALNLPASVLEIEDIFGKPSRIIKINDQYTKYIYDKLGIVFMAELGIDNYFKNLGHCIDKDHNIRIMYLYFGKKVQPRIDENKQELPTKPCCFDLILNGQKNALDFKDSEVMNQLVKIKYIGNFYCTIWPNINNSKEEIEDVECPLSIVFSLPIKNENEQKKNVYKINKNTENILHFENLNFKLAVIQVLMYELKVLEPYFDIYDFANQYTGKEIDTESEKIIRPALNFFKKLPIPKELASEVKEIYMDGGNEIYANIIPLWDGESDVFDVNDLNISELQQFPNLKKITLMTNNYENIKEKLKELEIEIDRL